MLSGKQCQAARALLGLSQAQLSDDTGISAMSLSAFERGGAMRASNKATVRQALETAGVAFFADGEMISGGEGVRLAMPSTPKAKVAPVVNLD